MGERQRQLYRERQRRQNAREANPGLDLLHYAPTRGDIICGIVDASRTLIPKAITDISRITCPECREKIIKILQELDL